jgi:hypothetical protein
MGVTIPLMNVVFGKFTRNKLTDLDDMPITHSNSTLAQMASVFTEFYMSTSSTKQEVFIRAINKSVYESSSVSLGEYSKWRLIYE